MFAPTIDVNRLFGVARETISDIERDYQRYYGVINGNTGLPVDVLANVSDDLDDIITHESHWKGDVGSFFTADDRSVNVTALYRQSKTLSASGANLASLVRGLVDRVKASRAATTNAEKEFGQQNKRAFMALKSANNALNYLARLRGPVVVAGTPEAELQSSS